MSYNDRPAASGLRLQPPSANLHPVDTWRSQWNSKDQTLTCQYNASGDMLKHSSAMITCQHWLQHVALLSSSPLRYIHRCCERLSKHTSTEPWLTAMLNFIHQMALLSLTRLWTPGGVNQADVVLIRLMYGSMKYVWVLSQLIVSSLWKSLNTNGYISVCWTSSYECKPFYNRLLVFGSLMEVWWWMLF